MLSFNQIVQVNVTLESLATTRFKFDVGLILGSSSVIPAATRVSSYDGLSSMTAAGFMDDMPEFKAAEKYFGQDPAPEKVYIGCIDTEEDPAEALAACLEKTNAFYGVYACGLTTAQVSPLATYVGPIEGLMLFYDNNDTYAAASAGSGVFATLKTADRWRAIGLWNTTQYSGAAMMGVCCGMANAYRNAAWALCYKELQDVTPSSGVTAEQVNTLKGLNANVFVTRDDYNLVENGAVANGMRYDEVMSIDRISIDLRKACADLIVKTKTKLPQNDATTTAFINACSAVCKKYKDMGVIDSGVWHGQKVATLEPGSVLTDGFAIMADSYSSQSSEDRLAKKAVPLYVPILLSGSVESIVIQVAVQL